MVDFQTSDYWGVVDLTFVAHFVHVVGIAFVVLLGFQKGNHFVLEVVHQLYQLLFFC